MCIRDRGIEKRDAGATDLNRLKVQLIENPGMSSSINRVLDADGEANPHREPMWTMTVDHPNLLTVEYVRFTESQILQVNREIQEMTRHRDDEARGRVDFLPPGARIARPQAFPEGSADDQFFAPLPEGEPATQEDIEHLQGEMLGMHPNIAQGLIDEAGEQGSVDILSLIHI